MAAMAATLLEAGMANAIQSGPAQSNPTTRKPPRLRAGDTVGLIQPAGFASDLSGPQSSIDFIRSLGLNPRVGAHVYDRHGYLAGTDESRAADINGMFADPAVRAIFCARGGWGSARALPFVNWDVVRANPKPLIGFSDITALHLAIATRGGFPTIHAPNAEANWGPQSLGTLRSLLFDAGLPFYQNPAGPAPIPAASPPALQTPAAPVGATAPVPMPVPVQAPPVIRPLGIETFRPGRASGRLLGGNLTVLSTLIGTPYLPSFDGAILFLEDVDEAVYSMDRMLTQLALSGILRRVAGVVFGRCARCGSPAAASSNFTLSDVLGRHLRPLGVPAFSGLMIGHIANQISVPVGVRAEMDADAGTLRALEAAVA